MHSAEKCVWWECSARRVQGKCSWCGVSMCDVGLEHRESWVYVAPGHVCTVWGTVRGVRGECAGCGTIFVGTWGTARCWGECAQGMGERCRGRRV